MKRNGLIEFYRFLFSLIIVFRHARNFWPEDAAVFMDRGALGVEFFFIISGYLMAVSAAKNRNEFLAGGDLAPDTRAFMKKKILGLMPELPIAAVISIIIRFAKIRPDSLRKIVEALEDWMWDLTGLSMSGANTGVFHMGIWYISAMLIAMFVLYPVCRRYFSMYVKVIAPLIAIFIIGAFTLKEGTPLGPYGVYGGVVYKGMLRAVAEVSLGAALYPFIEKFKKIDFTSFGRLCLSVILLFGTAFTLWHLIKDRSNSLDTATVLVIAVLVVLAFSHNCAGAGIFDNAFFGFLGKISFAIYLSHVEWSKYLKVLYKGWSNTNRFGMGVDVISDAYKLTLIYVAGAAVITAVIYVLSAVYKKHREGINNSLKKVFIKG